MEKREWIVGIDEVGRGPLAGPVCVCACAMPISEYRKMKFSDLNDSKKMTASARDRWYKKSKELKAKGALIFGVSFKNSKNVDSQGISKCIKDCIKNSIKKINLDPKKCEVLLDGGLKAPAEYGLQKTIIRGDQKKKIISLASVVAKVSRDKKMLSLHKKYPQYSWDKNKGYGTKVHIEAIKKHKPSPEHRKSFIRNILYKTKTKLSPQKLV